MLFILRPLVSFRSVSLNGIISHYIQILIPRNKVQYEKSLLIFHFAVKKQFNSLYVVNVHTMRKLKLKIRWGWEFCCFFRIILFLFGIYNTMEIVMKNEKQTTSIIKWEKKNSNENNKSGEFIIIIYRNWGKYYMYITWNKCKLLVIISVRMVLI